jgi:DNA-binding SARP family transcriptional activator
MSVAEQDDERQVRASQRHQLTLQAADRTLGQMEEHAAKVHDETLTCAVTTGRRALAEWQGLAGRLRELEAEYEQMARSESRALTRLTDALDLLDKFVEPQRMTSSSMRPGGPGAGGLAVPRPRGDPAGGVAVRMLGVFELALDGRRVIAWRGQRTQSVMQFLIAHRHRNVLRDELIAAVWPEADEDGGRHRLHQAVYELRSTLRVIDPGRSLIVCDGGGYSVDRSVPVWVDVEEFDELAASAARCLSAQQAGEAIELSQQALELYRGDFLSQVAEADWATTERNRLRTRFVQLSIHLGELLAGRGDHGPALAAVDPVLRMEPWNEDATVITMRCHARTGARSMAAAAYRSCAEALHREFGIAPAMQTTRVHEQIRAAVSAGSARGRLTAPGTQRRSSISSQ